MFCIIGKHVEPYTHRLFVQSGRNKYFTTTLNVKSTLPGNSKHLNSESDWVVRDNSLEKIFLSTGSTEHTEKRGQLQS